MACSVYLDGDDTRWNFQQASLRAGLGNAGKGSGPFRSVRVPGSATLARGQGNHHCEVALRGRSADPGTTTSQPQWGVWRSLTAHTRLLWNLSARVPCGTDNTLMNYTDLTQSRLRYRDTKPRNDKPRGRPAGFAEICMCKLQTDTIDV